MSETLVEVKVRTTQRIAKVRSWMRQHRVDAVVISNSDPSLNEYVGERWKGRSWLSGFDGSNGTIVVTKEAAGLWTDVRYYLIAEADIEGTEIELFRMNNPEVPTIPEWLSKVMKKGETVAVDGVETSFSFVEQLSQKLSDVGVELETSKNILDVVWSDRPKEPAGKIYPVGVKYTGKTISQKLDAVREKMRGLNLEHYLLGRSDEINWLLNLKGTDIPGGTAFYAHCLVSMNVVHLFINEEKLEQAELEMLASNDVKVHAYGDVFGFLEGLSEEARVMVVPAYMNYSLYEAVQHTRLNKSRPIITDLKAIKNEVELQNIRECMVRDGVAMVKSFKWIKDQLKTNDSFSEWDVLQQIEVFRNEIDDYAHSSFESIVGYNGNVALNHYMVSEDVCATIKPKGVLLIDAGGTYLSGTSDTTRVLAMGQNTARQRRDYTVIFKGLVALLTAKFPKGATGGQLDGVCRAPIWEHGLNFEHSTGHGIGFGLEVHEGPQGFSHRCTDAIKLGMVTTIEPAVYRPDEHGIRLENIVVCKESEPSDFGQCYEFENVTYCPFDNELIEVDLLTDEELNWLNKYHTEVYFKLSPSLKSEEKAWLSKACEQLER